jgi:hypothetical protein
MNLTKAEYLALGGGEPYSDLDNPAEFGVLAPGHATDPFEPGLEQYGDRPASVYETRQGAGINVDVGGVDSGAESGGFFGWLLGNIFQLTIGVVAGVAFAQTNAGHKTVAWSKEKWTDATKGGGA